MPVPSSASLSSHRLGPLPWIHVSVPRVGRDGPPHTAESSGRLLNEAMQCPPGSMSIWVPSLSPEGPTSLVDWLPPYGRCPWESPPPFTPAPDLPDLFLGRGAVSSNGRKRKIVISTAVTSVLTMRLAVPPQPCHLSLPDLPSDSARIRHCSYFTERNPASEQRGGFEPGTCRSRAQWCMKNWAGLGCPRGKAARSAVEEAGGAGRLWLTAGSS